MRGAFGRQHSTTLFVRTLMQFRYLVEWWKIQFVIFAWNSKGSQNSFMIFQDFFFHNCIVWPYALHYSYLEVLKVPRDNWSGCTNNLIILIQCHRFESISFQWEVRLYERTDIGKVSEKLDSIDWNALLSDLKNVAEMCNEKVNI